MYIIYTLTVHPDLYKFHSEIYGFCAEIYSGTVSLFRFIWRDLSGKSHHIYFIPKNMDFIPKYIVEGVWRILSQIRPLSTMQFINTGNQQARETFIRDTPSLPRAPPDETPAPLPGPVTDLVLPHFPVPPSHSVPPLPSPNAVPREVKRIPTTPVQRARLIQVLEHDPLL